MIIISNRWNVSFYMNLLKNAFELKRYLNNINLFIANASIKQTSTIARPSSIFTDSAFSLPTAYHEKTTPYGDYNDPGLDDSFDGFEGNEIEDDDDFSEVIEAINPNVQVSIHLNIIIFIDFHIYDLFFFI